MPGTEEGSAEIMLAIKATAIAHPDFGIKRVWKDLCLVEVRKTTMDMFLCLMNRLLVYLVQVQSFNPWMLNSLSRSMCLCVVWPVVRICCVCRCWQGLIVSENRVKQCMHELSLTQSVLLEKFSSLKVTEADEKDKSKLQKVLVCGNTKCTVKPQPPIFRCLHCRFNC